MNKQDQNLDDADFDSLFRGPRTLQGNEPIFYGQDPSSAILSPYTLPSDTQYTMSPQLLSMPPWQPSFVMPPLLNTQNDIGFMKDETSPQSAFSNDFGSDEEAASAAAGRRKRSRKKPHDEAPESPTTSRGKVSKRKSGGAAPAASKDEDKAREALLERNRIAASKCRERKKVHNAELENRSRTMSAENAVLKAAEAALRQELLELKYRCLEHSNCNCEDIREYMKKQALGPGGWHPSFGSDDTMRRASETSISNGQIDSTPTDSMSSNPLSPESENRKSNSDRRKEDISHYPQ